MSERSSLRVYSRSHRAFNAQTHGARLLSPAQQALHRPSCPIMSAQRAWLVQHAGL
ncbi:hypothetical protein FOMPIDRAFT_1022550, partial [Fomitopsis schrenkii]